MTMPYYKHPVAAAYFMSLTLEKSMCKSTDQKLNFTWFWKI